MQVTGPVQCGICKRWFRSRGGLAVHRCKGPARNNQQDLITNLASSLVEDHDVNPGVGVIFFILWLFSVLI